ncbi:MAG: sugar phosphate isomerase/epimerase [Actinobacteria bacterium]|nr:sugar phosphate isomerase/epimerase [Actinomycetota bacterium]
MKLNVDAHLGCLGIYAEKFLPSGYFEDLSIDQKLEIMSKIKGLTGIFTFYPTAPLPSDPDKLLKKLADYGLVVSNIAPSLTWGESRFKHGAHCTTEKNIIKETIKSYKEAIDFAKVIKADSVLLWPAHDGFDYPFQVNYKDCWKRLVETVREIGEYDTSIKIALEAKSKDPRQKQFINNTEKALTFINDVGLDNVGCALDIGHALMAGESLSESLMLLDLHKKLFQIHFNDNYKDADPDLMFGTINFWEILEFFYYFNKTDYKGWCVIDIISPRDDRAKSLEVCVKLVWKYKELADKLMKFEKEIDSNLKDYHFSNNMEILMGILF